MVLELNWYELLQMIFGWVKPMWNEDYFICDLDYEYRRIEWREELILICYERMINKEEWGYRMIEIRNYTRHDKLTNIHNYDEQILLEQWINDGFSVNCLMKVSFILNRFGFDLSFDINCLMKVWVDWFWTFNATLLCKATSV